MVIWYHWMKVWQSGVMEKGDIQETKKGIAYSGQLKSVGYPNIMLNELDKELEERWLTLFVAPMTV